MSADDVTPAKRRFKLLRGFGPQEKKEAEQLDRFLVRIAIGYPSEDAERDVGGSVAGRDRDQAESWFSTYGRARRRSAY